MKKTFLGIAIFLLIALLIWQILLKHIQMTGNASLSWNPGIESNIAGYRIYYGTSPRNGDCPPGGYTQNINTGKNPHYIIKNLEIGKTYYFSVTSYNASQKESCFSEEMKKTITISVLEQIKMILGIR